MRLLRVTKKIFRETLSFSAADVRHREKLCFISPNIALGPAMPMSKEQYVKEGMLSFGMFGGSGNVNGNTPNESAKSAMPQPEDFLNIPFRFITATTVGANSWKATDFSVEGVLKASVPKLDKVTIFSDHEQGSDNWAGLVTEPYWQEQFTASDGMLIPGGINGMASIDTKTNYRLARGVATGAVKSNSVTTAFDWEMSHKFDSVEEFYNSIGKMGKDGKMITRKVVDVLDYYESSMLWQGADPFAKKLDDKGQPIKVDWTSVEYSKAGEGEKEVYQKEKYFVVKTSNDKEILSLSKSGEKPITQNFKNNKNMKRFLLAFIAAFGPQLNLSFTTVEGEDLTAEQEAEVTTALAKIGITPTEAPKLDEETQASVNFTKQLKTVDDKGAVIPFSLKDNKAEVIVLSKEAKEALDTKVTELTKEVSDLKPLATAGEASMKFKREETLRLYKASLGAGKQPDAAIEKNINDAAPDLLESLLKQYAKDGVIAYGATCTKCGNADSIEMRSTIEPDDKVIEPATGFNPVSTSDMHRKFSKNGLLNR